MMAKNAEHDQVSLVSAALVREWLKRHGLTNTLSTLETELPRGEDAISSRTELGKALGIEKQLRRNKEKEKASDPGALLSTLEVLADFVIRSAQAKGEKEKTAGGENIHGHHKHAARKSPEATHAPLKPLHSNNSPSQQQAVSASITADRTSSGSTFAQPSFRPSSREEQIKATRSSDLENDMASMEVEDFDEDSAVETVGDPGRRSSHGTGAHGGSSGAGAWIGVQQAVELRSLVFGVGGSRSSFGPAWMQGFYPNGSRGVEWGLVQAAGGPCGVLASVQAYIIRHLLFVENRVDVAGISKATFDQAVVAAVADILWQAGGERSACVCIQGHKVLTADDQDRMRAGKIKPDGITEQINVMTATSRSSLLDVIKQNSSQFTDPEGAGVPLLLYSAVLSRGIANVKADIGTFDGQPRLMGAHDYCTQEMVNLLLVGRAVPNTFDGNKDLDGLALNGIHKRSDVGLLTLFEHYGSMEVGSLLKSPRSPVWVVCSESHFSVCFAKDADQVQNATERGGEFDLHYYDELAKMDEPVRLTVSFDLERAKEAKVIEEHSRDMTPPLEHCIRTKWAHAAVDWNGTDPIL